MASNSTTFGKGKQPSKRRGKSERTKILEAMSRAGKTEEGFYDELVARAENPDDNKSDHYNTGPSSREVFSSLGRLWTNKWLGPFEKSPRVKGDEQQSNSFFLVDVNGAKVCGSELRAHEGWLWFKPDLIPEILKRKRSCPSQKKLKPNQPPNLSACTHMPGG